MSSRNKRFRCNITFPGKGRPARTEIIEALNPPEARELAELRFGGKCTSPNMVS